MIAQIAQGAALLLLGWLSVSALALAFRLLRGGPAAPPSPRPDRRAACGALAAIDRRAGRWIERPPPSA